MRLKDLLPQIRAQKIFSVQRRGFKPKQWDNFA